MKTLEVHYLDGLADSYDAESRWEAAANQSLTGLACERCKEANDSDGEESEKGRTSGGTRRRPTLAGIRES